MLTSKTARVEGWGSAPHARRVSYLTRDERALIRAGGVVLIEGCPSVRGCTTRRVVAIGGRFYTRMPI